jgi:voltage-gated potassium channel
VKQKKFLPPVAKWRRTLHEIIFEADTPIGKAFDIALIYAILISVLIVLLDSINSFHGKYGAYIALGEWFFTLLFTTEYICRIVAVRAPKRYIFSFFGIVDLLSILPTYLSIILPGTHVLIVVRALRLLRLFRVLKMARYVEESNVLLRALAASRPKITVFVMSIISISVIVGSLMYLIEGPENGFTSIPVAMYWVIVTITTVGYGDISPQTPIGQMLASLLMIMAYGILAVPTGIITYELSKAADKPVSTQACPFCGKDGHEVDATFCKYCGNNL